MAEVMNRPRGRPKGAKGLKRPQNADEFQIVPLDEIRAVLKRTERKPRVSRAKEPNQLIYQKHPELAGLKGDEYNRAYMRAYMLKYYHEHKEKKIKVKPDHKAYDIWAAYIRAIQL